MSFSAFLRVIKATTSLNHKNTIIVVPNTEGGIGKYVRGEQEMCKRCREAFGVGPRSTLREEPVTARDEMGKVGVPAQR